jgi:hypothetical protein
MAMKLFARLFQTKERKSAHSNRLGPRQHPFKPRLEGLEQRLAPAILVPAQIRQAYGIDQIRFGTGTVGNGAGQTIALVVIGIDNSLVSDLQYFDQQLFGSGPDGAQLLDTFGSYNGPQTGSTEPWLDLETDPNFPPRTDYTRAQISKHDVEADIDVEWAHVVAPMANIVVVQTGSIQAGTLYASQLRTLRPELGISIIASSSYHFPTFHPEDYADPNVTYIGITGDTGTSADSQQLGFGLDNYPASSPDIVAVGGTTLTLNPDNSYGSETGWGFAGPSNFLPASPVVLNRLVTWSQTSGGFSGQYWVGANNSGSVEPARATWTTTVTDSYPFGVNDHGLEISATWPASTTNARAQFSIYDNGNLVQSADVNEQHAPTGTVITQQGLNPTTFQELGTLTNVQPGDTIEVVLQADLEPGQTLAADTVGFGPDDASGGGLSNEPQPSYQNGLVIHDGNTIVSSNGTRANPDVAFDGDYINSPVEFYDQGSVIEGQSTSPIRAGAGTSLGAPAWAGLIAIADQGLAVAGHAPLTTAQALARLYSLPSHDFHDETTGYNGYSAGPGYDLVTGLGSPVANRLIPDLVGTVASVSVFVVPVSQPVDATHVHTLAAAVQVAGDFGTVTIEPGASPDAGQVTIGNTGITIQGDPNVPASILPTENILFTGANSTLTNLNLSELVLGNATMPGDTSTSGNHVSGCFMQDLNEYGVQSTFTQNTISTAAFAGNRVSTNGDMFADNVIRGRNPFGALRIVNCDGITVTHNTITTSDDGIPFVQGIFVEDSGNAGNPVTIENNYINTFVTRVQDAADISVEQGLGITNVAILNNTIISNGGTGLALSSAVGSNLFALVQGNDFHGNGIGISISGDGTVAGNVDLGGGSFNGMRSSLGGNDFRSFTAIGTESNAAIVLTNTSPTAVIPAANNIFRPGTDPAFVVDDGVEGSLTGTGQINAAAKLDDAHAFVQTLYNNLLGRTGTPAELDLWSNLLARQGQAVVVNDILHSSEALGRIVDSFYLRFLGRAADPGGRAGWIGYLQNGGTEEKTESLFLTSPEYLSHINVDFVQSLYLNILGRPGSPAEVAAWNNNIQNVGGIMGVANAFTHSPENRLNALRSDFQTFLHRTPADAELMPLVNTSLDLLSLEGAVLSSSEFFTNG